MAADSGMSLPQLQWMIDLQVHIIQKNSIPSHTESRLSDLSNRCESLYQEQTEQDINWSQK